VPPLAVLSTLQLRALIRVVPLLVTFKVGASICKAGAIRAAGHKVSWLVVVVIVATRYTRSH
jgi:hypothetical protein